MCEKVKITCKNSQLPALAVALELNTQQENGLFSIETTRPEGQFQSIKVATRGTLKELKDFLINNGAKFVNIESLTKVKQ